MSHVKVIPTFVRSHISHIDSLGDRVIESYRLQYQFLTSNVPLNNELDFSCPNIYRPMLLPWWTEREAANRDDHCSGQPGPLPRMRFPGPMCLVF